MNRLPIPWFSITVVLFIIWAAVGAKFGWLLAGWMITGAIAARTTGTRTAKKGTRR